jgi:alpha-tubulin suppressor-like RCC1 family protein
VFVDRRGDAYGWGKSADGATGVGIFAVTMAGPLRNGALRDAGRIRRAAVSKHHTLVLACDGKVYGFGKNASHELDANAGATFAGPLRVFVPPGGGFGAKTKELCSNDDADDTAACVAIAAGAFVENRDSGASFSFSRGGAHGASAAVRASDGRVLTWGAPRPWLGRGGRVDDAWAPGNEPAPVRFEETASFDDERDEKAAKDEASGPSRAAAVA